MAKGGPESSSQYEDGPKRKDGTDRKSGATDKQMEALRDGETDAETVKATNRDVSLIHSNIRNLLAKDQVLGKEEKEAYEKELDAARNKSNPGRLAAIKKDIDQNIDASHKLLQSFVGQLDKNTELFGKDKARNIDVRDDKEKEFKEANLDGKKEGMKKLDGEIKSLRTIRDNLIKVIGDGKGAKTYMDRFGKMTENEKVDYVDTMKENMAAFNKLFEQLKKTDISDDDELESLGIRFGEATPEGQKKMLAEMEQELKDGDVKSVKDEFKKFSEPRQKKYESALKKARGLKAKKEVVEEMKGEIREEAIAKWTASPLQSPFEKNINAKYMGEEKDAAKLEASLAYIPTAEKTLKGFEAKFKAAPAKVQAQYDFYNVNFTGNGNQLGKKEIAAECEKHMELIGKWDTKLKDAVGNKLVSEISAGKYKDKFAGATIKEKEAALQNSTLDDPRRKESLTRFNKLPAGDQQKHKEFYSLRLRDRMALVENIENDNHERKELCEKYNDKIQEMADGRLLSPKSVKAYKQWFASLETTDEMKEMLENSDLDDPRRDKVLETFENLPESQRKKHESIFMNQDLSERIQTLCTILPDGGNALKSSLNGMQEAKSQVDEMQKKTELKVKLEDAMKFEGQKNFQAEFEIRKDIAKLDPEDEINNARLTELQIMVSPNAESIGKAIDASKGNSTMRDQLEANAVYLRMAHDIKQHELLTQERTFDQRSALHASTEDKNLSKDFADFTDGESIIDARTGRAQDAVVFKMTDFQNLNRDQIHQKKKALKQDRLITDETQRGKRYNMIDKDGQQLDSTKLENRAKAQSAQITAAIVSRITGGSLSEQAKQEAQKAVEAILLDNNKFSLDVAA